MKKTIKIEEEIFNLLMKDKYDLHFKTISQVIRHHYFVSKNREDTKKNEPLKSREFIQRDFGPGEPPKDEDEIEKPIVDDGKMTFRETKRRL